MTDSSKSRVAFLRERVAAATRKSDRATFPVPFRQRQANLVVTDVPIEFPLYNVLSGRTHRAQAEYIDRHGVAADFFADPEDDDVQRAQHEILLAMVDDAGLARDLHEKSQRNPLVLTYDGFVVDGNRRLAALRRDGDAQYVSAVVLPEDATPAEVYETEVELQMALETKAAYSWIDEALHVSYGVRQLYDKKKPQEAAHAVAQRMNMDDKEIQAILQRLALVDSYLAWSNQRGKYHLIPAGAGGGAMEQAFKELAQLTQRQQVKRLHSTQQKAIREACFAVIASGGGYKDVRNVVSSMRTRPNDFLDRAKDLLPDDLKPRLNDAETARSEPEEIAAEGDLLAELAAAEGDGEPPAGTAVLQVVGESENGRRAGQALIDAAAEIEAEEKDAQRHIEPHQQIARALKSLQAVTLTAETPNLDQLVRSLAELLELAERLTADVERLRSEGD
ncbi:MAG: hypothetical protein M3N24_04235 [Actinomycetota bacterium]|nr:hypothetical protein [Actinomycetota bacterium]